MRLRIALCGDLMLGRGIDQIQRSHVNPELRERFVTDARDYIALAERRGNTEIPRGVEPAYVWSDARERLERFGPQVTLANNHVLDSGVAGLEETCAALDRARVPYCGAGRNGEEVSRPVVVEASAPDAPPDRRIAVIGCCLGDSGVSSD